MTDLIKKCEYCGVEFSPKNSRQKFCSSLCRDKKFRETNKNKLREYKRKYYRDNRTKVLRQKKRYYQKRKEKALEEIKFIYENR